jgi:hypothetical protein
MPKTHHASSALLLGCALSLVGCEALEQLKKAKADLEGTTATSASSGPTGPLSADPDEALGLKLNSPIECINNASSTVSRSRERYLSWITDPKVGPTGTEKLVYGLYEAQKHMVDKCKKELATLKKVNEPPTPDLDKLAAGYETKLDAVVPLIEAAHKYYSQKTYQDDKFAKGKSMHADLMKAYDEFDAADKGLRDEVTKLKSGMAEREIAKVEKTEGKKLRWHKLRTNMVGQKLVQAGDKEPTKLDVAAFEAVIKEYAGAVDELDAYVKAHGDEASKVMMFSSYQSESRELVKAAEALLRRAREKKPYSQSEIMMINGGNPQMIEGHPAHFVNAYNEMVKASNNLRW